MSIPKIVFFAFCLLFFISCVTINVYFPAAAAEQAADQIIDGVWGTEGPPPGEKSATDAQSTSSVPASTANPGEVDLDISSPAIKALEQSMAQRHEQLKKYYNDGSVALSNDALIMLRKPAKIPLKDRTKLRSLVEGENQDRLNLYRQIALANGHPEWETDIRQIFEKRWIKRAKAGWWYQDKNGQWQSK
jgi:hypothetical protein